MSVDWGVFLPLPRDDVLVRHDAGDIVRSSEWFGRRPRDTSLRAVTKVAASVSSGYILPPSSPAVSRATCWAPLLFVSRLGSRQRFVVDLLTLRSDLLLLREEARTIEAESIMSLTT